MRFKWFIASTVVAASLASAQGIPGRPSGKVLHDAAGDIVDKPGKIDATLSPRLTHKNVRAAIKKVADWELVHNQSRFTQDWTYAPLYSGLLAASATTGDKKYHDVVLHTSERFDWKLLPGRYDHADDEAIGQIYEVLYLEDKDPKRIAAVKDNFAQVMVRTRNLNKDLWWWCDALYMAPPSLAMMTKITGDRKYINFMDSEWDLTTQHLYYAPEKLYFRDASFLKKTEKNGKPLFWSRGNGWVLAGTARVLSTMDKKDPLRPKYEKLFREMADRIAELQPEDGLWRMGLLDEKAYDMGEVSGTGFFTYAMAWGVNNGVLDKKKFMPVIERGWAGMLKRIYEDGRLGSVQPIGAAPDALRAGSSWAYGSGSFLLAGSEIDKLAK